MTKTPDPEGALIGFADLSANAVRKYMEFYISQAISVEK